MNFILKAVIAITNFRKNHKDESANNPKNNISLLVNINKVPLGPRAKASYFFVYL